MWTLGKGSTFYSDYFFDPDRTLKVLVEERITEFYPAYQPVMEAIVGHPDFRGKIASFKLPRVIRFISGDEWPMSATKIQRFRLRERRLEELKV